MKLREILHAVSHNPGMAESRAVTTRLPEPHPWYVATAVSLTIWVGAVALGSFLVAIRMFSSAEMQLAGGVMLLGLGAVCSRAATGLLRLHLSLIGYASCTALLFVFLDNGVELGKGATLLGVAAVQALCFLFIDARPVRFKAMFGMVLALWGAALESRGAGTIDALVLAASVLLTGLWLYEARLSATPVGRMVRPAGFALAAGLLWLSTFSLTTWTEARPAWPTFTAAGLAALLLVVTRVAAREAESGRGNGAVRLAVAGIVALAALAAHSPAILTAVLVLALGRLRKEPVLEGLGLLGLVGFAVWLYYGMHVSLLWTSVALAAAGVALIAARAWLLRGGVARPEPVGASVLSPQPRVRPKARRAWLALPSLAVVAAVLGLVVHKEHIVSEGRTVLLELAPQDPRSFLQGDYVALGYAASEPLLAAVGWDSPQDHLAVFRIDEDGVGHYVAVDERAALADDEVRIRAMRRRFGYAFGADSYFFSEGRGGEWERARYAELKVAADGSSVLVGLRDKERALMR